MRRASWGRALLFAAPLTLAAGALGGVIAASAALGLWLAGMRMLIRPGTYPKQRRSPPRRYALAWASGSLVMLTLKNAVPLPEGLPSWAGTVFFSLTVCRRVAVLPLPRRAGRWAGGLCAGLFLMLLYLW